MAYDSLIEAYNIACDVKNKIDTLYKDKSMDQVIHGGNAFKKEVLADSVFLLKNAMDKLLTSIDMNGLSKDQNKSNDYVRKSDLQNIFDSMIPVMADKLKDRLFPSESSSFSGPTVSNVVSDTKKTDHVIVVHGENGENKFSGFDDTKWNEIVKKDLSSKLKSVPIKSSVKTQSGKACLFVDNESAVSQVKEALQSEYNVEVNRSKKVAPKVKMFNIDTSVYQKDSAEKLKNDILEKNNGMKLLYDSKNDNFSLDVILINTDNKFAILKMGEGLRSYVRENSNRIYLNLTSHVVKDNFHLTQCFKCQKFGHKAGSSHCSDIQICLYCSKEHRSAECPVKKDPHHHNCSNCFSSSEFRKHSHGHRANSLQCPIFINETEQLMRKTAGVTQDDFLRFRTKVQNKQVI